MGIEYSIIMGFGVPIRDDDLDALRKMLGVTDDTILELAERITQDPEIPFDCEVYGDMWAGPLHLALFPTGLFTMIPVEGGFGRVWEVPERSDFVMDIERAENLLKMYWPVSDWEMRPLVLGFVS